MSETVTILSIVPKKTGAKNGKPWTISEVTLEDGRKLDTFDTFAVGQVVEVDISKNANPQYNDNLKKAKSAAQANAGNFKNAEAANKAIEHNIAKDERISMLSCISSACNFYQQREATEEKVIKFAERLFSVAVKRTDDLPFILAIFILF